MNSNMKKIVITDNKDEWESIGNGNFISKLSHNFILNKDGKVFVNNMEFDNFATGSYDSITTKAKPPFEVTLPCEVPEVKHNFFWPDKVTPIEGMSYDRIHNWLYVQRKTYHSGINPQTGELFPRHIFHSWYLQTELYKLFCEFMTFLHTDKSNNKIWSTGAILNFLANPISKGPASFFTYDSEGNKVAVKSAECPILNNALIYLLASTDDSWDWIGDVNDPSKPMFKDKDGKDVYLRLQDVYVQTDTGGNYNSLLYLPSSFQPNFIFDGLKDTCIYLFTTCLHIKPKLYSIVEGVFQDKLEGYNEVTLIKGCNFNQVISLSDKLVLPTTEWLSCSEPGMNFYPSKG